MSVEEYTVYIRVDDAGRVVGVNSSAFVRGTNGWTAIDAGRGDRYHHAQGNYLPGPLVDERGICRYKLDGGAVVERTQEEMDADWVEPEPAADPMALFEAAYLAGVNEA